LRLRRYKPKRYISTFQKFCTPGIGLLCRRLEDESDPNKPEARPRTRIVDAIQSFRDDEDARHLTEGTLKKSRYFFETQLKEWAEPEKLIYLDQITPALLTKFRAGWTNAAQTVQRKHERLIAFFWFCIRMEWITKNPAVLLKRVKVETTPTDYFPKAEFQALVNGGEAPCCGGAAKENHG
jgi:integrase/recombinase XerD